MERKLKERITGAALLVVAGVVLIPWVLDGQVGSQRVDQGLVIPPPGGSNSGVRTIVLDAGDQASSSAPPTPARTTPREPARPVPVEVPARSESSNRTAPAPDPAPASNSRAADVETAPEPPPAATTANAPVPARKAAPDPAAGWAVQVGSFASEANARKLADELVGLEYKAFVSRKMISGRAMYRVRVGPRATRDEAATLADRLRKDRQPVRIVEHPG